MSYTLITGATGVLGKCFALECASRGENLYLTGRSLEKLEALKKDILGLYAVQVRVYPCDLCNSEMRKALYADAGELAFSRLINVAGADIQKPFAEYGEDKLTFQIRANFEGAVSMCGFALSHRAEELNIINISSISGAVPMPYFAVYSAAKRALTQFSVAFREEVKKMGVKVCAVLPGAIYTRSDVIDYIAAQGLWGKLAAKSPQFVVQKSLQACARNRAVVVPGVCNKLAYAAAKIIPLKLQLKFIAHKWSKTRKDAFPV